MNFLQNEDNEDNDVFIEAELLRGMYPEDDKLQILQTNPQTVTFTLQLSPATGGSHLSFVKINLELTLNISNYPEQSPAIKLKKSRGLEETQQIELLKILQHECQELQGDFVCSSLAQLAEDFLTLHNVPPRCSICLEAISSEGLDSITTNDCFHIFHAQCLTSWWTRCALSAATGYRSVSRADQMEENENWISLVNEHQNASNTLKTYEHLLAKAKRKINNYIQRRKKMDRPGSLSENEKLDIVKLNDKIRNVEIEIENLKIQKKDTLEIVKTLKWKVAESKERLDKLNHGIRSLPTIEFEFQCPVCRSTVEKKILMQYLKLNEDGSVTSPTCSSADDKKVATVKKEQNDINSGKVPDEFREYVEEIKKYQESLLNGLHQQKKNADNKGERKEETEKNKPAGKANKNNGNNNNGGNNNGKNNNGRNNNGKKNSSSNTSNSKGKHNGGGKNKNQKQGDRKKKTAISNAQKNLKPNKNGSSNKSTKDNDKGKGNGCGQNSSKKRQPKKKK